MKTLPLIQATTLIILATMTISCDSMEYEKTTFENPNNNSSDATSIEKDLNLNISDVCKNKVELYSQTVKDLVDSSCKSCHASGASAATVFTFENQDTANVDILQEITNGDAEQLIKKLNGELNHGGGQLIDEKGELLINGFFEAVDACR